MDKFNDENQLETINKLFELLEKNNWLGPISLQKSAAYDETHSFLNSTVVLVTIKLLLRFCFSEQNPPSDHLKQKLLVHIKVLAPSKKLENYFQLKMDYCC